MQVLIEINEGDLLIATQHLKTGQEYVKAILESAERSPAGIKPEESIELLGRANALHRAYYALRDFKQAVLMPAANDEEAASGA